MRKALIGIGVAMLLAGMLLGPGYYFYCTQFSGAPLGKFPVSGRAGKWTLSDGSSQSFPGGRAATPFSIDLEPAMNPVRFNWRATVSGIVMAGPTEYNPYRAWLFLGGRPAMQENFSLSLSEKESGTSWRGGSIGQFTVTQAGRYDFVVEETREPRFSVSDLQIEVRRNAMVPDRTILVWGGALFGASFVLIFFVLANGGFPAWVVLAMVLVGGWMFWNISTREKPAPPVLPAAVPKAPPPQDSIVRMPRDRGPIEIIEWPITPVIGEPVVLRGTNFGLAQNHRLIVAGSGVEVVLEILEWGPDLIKARIPDDPGLREATYYHFGVERISPRAKSNLVGINVVRPK